MPEQSFSELVELADYLIDAVCDLRASVRDGELDDAASHALAIQAIAHDFDTKARRDAARQRKIGGST